MTLVPACSGWVSRLEQRISLIIMEIIIITQINLTPTKEGVVVEEVMDLTKAEAEVEVVVVIMPTVTPFKLKQMRR